MLDSRLIPNVTVPADIWRSAMAQPEAALSAIVEMMDGKPEAIKSKKNKKLIGKKTNVGVESLKKSPKIDYEK